jgi:putative hydrolase of the HAD superfamily
MYRIILFDLDDTLYPRESGLMVAIGERITHFVSECVGVTIDEAKALRKYFRETYGTALRGLTEEGYRFDIDEYFRFVHDVSLDTIQPNPQTRWMLLNMPLRRAVFTNSNVEHAERILSHLNIRDCFESIIDIRALNFICKPDLRSYATALEMMNVRANETILVEDMAVNTKTAKALGMQTILVDHPPSDDAHVVVNELNDVGAVVSSLIKKTNGMDAYTSAP